MNLLFVTYMNQSAQFVEEALDSVQFTHSYWVFLAPLIMMASDIITGWVQATINRTWDSTKMRYGLLRKSAMMLVVIVAYLFEFAIIGLAQIHLANFAAAYVIVMEAISICENLDQAGVPIPGFIRDRLLKVKDGMDKADNADMTVKG